ncbi:hypothetical protein [Priestia megaterium]|uniref:hypothetical protein n=1 Tax=Priestia megaterium TaxID=1404 RepID=UPI00245325AF|nr:hypothetical protein [Priestia megaterium]MDH3183682.1 hypothetical protein [Priestia megaterium]
MTYEQYWKNIHTISDKVNSSFTSYWAEYSDWGTWQFWALFASLVLPLVVLYFTVDRKRIFELFFSAIQHICYGGTLI